MTSVQSSTRQIPLATTFYQIPAGFTDFYQLNNTTSSYTDNGGSVNQLASVGSPIPGTTGLIARDMGKTVKWSNAFYREIQLLGPQLAAPAADAGGIVGGGLTMYGVYYILVPMSGFGSVLSTMFTPIAGGQM
jgi:hypothetical protein